MKFKENISITEQMRTAIAKYTYEQMVKERAVEILMSDACKKVAKAALKINLDLERISDITGLPLEQVEALRAEVTA